MFDKINMSELKCCMNGMDMTFKLATSPSLNLITLSRQFLVLRTVKTLVSSLDEICMIFKVAALDELDDVSQ